MIDLGDEMEATIVRLQLAIIAKPITAPPPVPTTADVEASCAFILVKVQYQSVFFPLAAAVTGRGMYWLNN